MDLPDPSPPGGPAPGGIAREPWANPWERASAVADRLRDDRRLAAVAVAAVLAALAVGYLAVTALQPAPPPRPEDVLPRVALSPTSAPTTTAAPVLVHVVGAVAAPGVREVPAGARIIDALHAAGGPTAEADLAQLNLAAPVSDGSQIRVPTVGEAPAGPLVVPPSGPAPAGAEGGGPAAEPIDLNAATPDELEQLPGIGPATAAAIATWRTTHGPFASVEQLLEVRGIGPAKFEALRDLVVVR